MHCLHSEVGNTSEVTRDAEVETNGRKGSDVRSELRQRLRANRVTLRYTFPDSTHHNMVKSSHRLVTRFQEQHQEQLDRDFNCGILNAETYANLYNINQGLTPTVRCILI